MKTFLAAAVLIVLSLVCTGCSSWQDADVKEGWRSPGGTRISLLIGTCNARLRSRVEETEREVRVLVSARNGETGDCADAHTILLSEPLGDRLLIDESDGEPVGVSLNENMPDALGR
ncbi:MAG: hypothetical protein FIB00_04840 [Chloroflexi bacterium]|nr:hypothetical protein [Chloroflexota bacterium]PWB43275.1 MAG: hypothetical protein C3F10_11315 [Dehalococcoidia bacterium]